MNRICKASIWIAVFVFILLISVGSGSAQKRTLGGLVGPLWEDTAINPHDFTDDYYSLFGIKAKAILARRTGTDGLSVFSNSSNPFHTNVRVTITAPAYDQNGEMLFWYPLGELQEYAMSDELRELAVRFPIYVFPNSQIVDYRSFANTRQAALMDNSFGLYPQDDNPLGIRQIIVVNYTEKAFGKDGYEMMSYMMEKNGAAADDTPIIRTIDDIELLAKHDMISTDTLKSIGGRYAINPIIFDPTNGVIAKDAFIWMATKDERWLLPEDNFVYQFNCLKKLGYWCK